MRKCCFSIGSEFASSIWSFQLQHLADTDFGLHGCQAAQLVEMEIQVQMEVSLVDTPGIPVLVATMGATRKT